MASLLLLPVSVEVAALSVLRQVVLTLTLHRPVAVKAAILSLLPFVVEAAFLTVLPLAVEVGLLSLLPFAVEAAFLSLLSVEVKVEVALLVLHRVSLQRPVAVESAVW